jgi:hypothetical protein
METLRLLSSTTRVDLDHVYCNGVADVEMAMGLGCPALVAILEMPFQVLQERPKVSQY